MLKKVIYKLKIDGDFKRLIPQLSVAERKQLEENIIQDGCRDALVVWDNTIIDGHNRYEICIEHGIPFEISGIDIRSREEAVSWICNNQLGRRNISEETKRYLIGKRYEMEKQVNAQRNASGVNQHTEREVCAQNDHKPQFPETATRTSERLGREYHLGCNTVRRFGAYARALDVIEKAAPEFHEKIMSGELKVTQESVTKIARFTPPEIRSAGGDLMGNPTAHFAFTDGRCKMRKNAPSKIQLEQMKIGGIKNTPAYDPDAEVTSLTLTIPSWKSSITRVLNITDFNGISRDASKWLSAELIKLKYVVDKLLVVIEEVFR